MQFRAVNKLLTLFGSKESNNLRLVSFNHTAKQGLQFTSTIHFLNFFYFLSRQTETLRIEEFDKEERNLVTVGGLVSTKTVEEARIFTAKIRLSKSRGRAQGLKKQRLKLLSWLESDTGERLLITAAMTVLSLSVSFS